MTKEPFLCRGGCGKYVAMENTPCENCNNKNMSLKVTPTDCSTQEIEEI